MDEREDGIFETGTLTEKERGDFLEWFDDKIGTEWDVTQHDDVNNYTITCFELTSKDVSAIKGYLNNLKRS